MDFLFYETPQFQLYMDPKAPSDAPSPKDTGYTPGEDSATRWRNWFLLLTGQMTDQGKEQYRRDRDLRHEKADCERCEKHRDFLLQYSVLLSGQLRAWLTQHQALSSASCARTSTSWVQILTQTMSTAEDAILECREASIPSMASGSAPMRCGIRGMWRTHLLMVESLFRLHLVVLTSGRDDTCLGSPPLQG